MLAKKTQFIAIDGPNGVGKSTIISLLNEKLIQNKYTTYLTKEPTTTKLGNFIRSAEENENLQSDILAYLIAADRQQHIKNEINPKIGNYDFIITDRYIASSLILQGMQDISFDFIWHINQEVIKPDINFFIYSEEKNIIERLDKRKNKTRFERENSTLEEIEFCKKAENFLIEKGFICVNIFNDQQISQTVKEIYQRITS